MGRRPCCDKVGLKKGPWTAEEDKKLVNFLASNGHCCWRVVPKLAGLLRCGKSCRLRWTNYLRPDLKRGVLSDAEESLIIELHARLGNRWSKIASHLPGRTDNEIKNYWNTHIKKKLRRMGIDPATHLPLLEPEPSEPSGQLKNGAEPANVTAKRLSSDQHKRNQFLPQENLKPIKLEAEISETISNNAPPSEEFKQNNLFLTEIPCKMEANPDAPLSQLDTTLLLPGSFEGLWEYSDNITDCFESAQYGVTWFDHQSSTDHVFETPEVIPASSESSTHFLLQSVDNNFPPWEQPGTSQRVFPLDYQN